MPRWRMAARVSATVIPTPNTVKSFRAWARTDWLRWGFACVMELPGLRNWGATAARSEASAGGPV